MKNSIFILGSVEALVGITLLSITEMIKNIMPYLGRIAYQAASAGSYSPRDYAVSFTIPVILSLVLIVVGVVQIAFSIKKKDS